MIIVWKLICKLFILSQECNSEKIFMTQITIVKKKIVIIDYDYTLNEKPQKSPTTSNCDE